MARSHSAGSGLSIGYWVAVIVGVVILVQIVAGLLTPFNNALKSYAANDTSGFGKILETIGPYLLGAAILLAIVFVLLPYGRKHMG